MNMNDVQIMEKLTEIFKDVLDDETLMLDADMKFEEIEGWDSLQNIHILVAVEEEWNVKINVQESVGLFKVGMLVDLIKEKLTV